MAGPNNRAFATSQTQMGLAIETVIGTPPAQPKYMFPVKSPKFNPDQMYIPDETLQGSMVQIYDLVQGMRYDAHGWEAPPYLDSFPIMLRALLGSTDNLITAPTNTTLAAAAAAGAPTVSTTASVAAGKWVTIGTAATLETHLVLSVSGAGPFTVTLVTPLINAQANGAAVTGLTGHQFSLLNNSVIGDQPPSVSIWDGDGEEWRLLTASQLDELTIKGNATGLTSYTCSWLANPATPNVAAPTTSYTQTQTPAPWTFFATLGGTYTPTIVDWEFSFKRGTKPIPALTGTVEYLQYFAGPLQATGKLVFTEQSSSPQLNQYLNGVRQALDCTLFDLITGFALNVHSTRCQFKKAEIDRSKEWVEVPVEFQLLPTTTDALAGGVSPVIATVANSITTSY